MAKNTHKIENILLVLFALAGMAIMGYLISLHFSETEGAFCNLGEGLSCDVVNKSIYSKIFGIPMSVLGFLYFAWIFALVLWRREKTPYRIVALATIIFLGPSLYLTGVELFILENICVFCELSKALMLAIAITAFIALGKEKFSLAQVFIAIFLAAALGWATYFVHAGAIPSGTYIPFAQCVYEKGMRMYGAKTCSACVKQRELFGDAAPYIREIECDPRYPGSEVARCVAKQITRTPTWIREDAAGNTLKRFDPGVLSLETLAEETGCVLPI